METRLVPAAMPANMIARWAIDLSAGTVSLRTLDFSPRPLSVSAHTRRQRPHARQPFSSRARLSIERAYPWSQHIAQLTGIRTLAAVLRM